MGTSQCRSVTPKTFTLERIGGISENVNININEGHPGKLGGHVGYFPVTG